MNQKRGECIGKTERKTVYKNDSKEGKKMKNEMEKGD